MSEFETALETCLEFLREGRWSMDECLRRYPEHADALRPYLWTAVSVARAFEAQPREAWAAEARERFRVATGEHLQRAMSAQPRDEWAAAARERFLVASGDRIREAYDEEPAPSFFAVARVRFLAAAHRMRLGARAGQAARLPLFGTPFRALTSAALALIMFLSFSTYTIATASESVPGDWRYPIKRQTERVRLALAFGEGAKRDVKLDLAAERSKEIEKLAQKGKIIGPGVLEDLAKQTAPLVESVNAETWDRDDIARLQAITQKQKVLLDQVRPQVAPAAEDELVVAAQVSNEGASRSLQEFVKTEDPIHITPSVPVTDTPEPDDAEQPTETPEATPTLGPGETPVPPTPVATLPPSNVLTLDPEPESFAAGIVWVRITQGRFSALIPSEADGWRVTNSNLSSGVAPADKLIQLSNSNGTELITLNPSNGDMYWFVLRNGRFDEVQLRGHDGKQVLVIDRDALRAAYGAAADLPLFVLDSIELAPVPTPTPEPTQTPTPTLPAAPSAP